MPKTYDIDGVIVDVVNPMLGEGGLGRVEQVALSADKQLGLVVKHLELTSENKERVKALVGLKLPLLSPYLAAPIASKCKGDEILHLAPLAIGHDLLSDNRKFPENMELAFHLACLLTILEEQGIPHGDLAPSNLMITEHGEVYLIDFDNFTSTSPDVPKPSMAGQHMMLAPELRGNNPSTPDQYSDRFSLGVTMNLLLLRRHPAGDAKVPADVARALSSGLWPERQRIAEQGDVPIEALGAKLAQVFDEAFVLQPDKRPSPDAWRRTLGDVLQNLALHDCGGVFVLDKGQTSCPWCQASIGPLPQPDIQALKLTLPGAKRKYRVPLVGGKTLVLGRANLGGATAAVSNKHLELTPMGKRVFLRHIGRHQTQILKDGQWYQLKSVWLELDDIALAPVPLRLADLHIDIGV